VKWLVYEVKEEKSKDGRKVLRIDREHLLELVTELKKSGYDSLSLISAVDFRDRIEMIYHLTNSKTEELIVVKSETRDSKMPSLTSMYESANWDEREQYDMMGIIFEGHPNLKRILLPEGWVGYPLRKDYDLSKIQYVNMDDEGNDYVSFDPGDGW
jgi:NADH-quinone oxidoreductase subunit C